MGPLLPMGFLVLLVAGPTPAEPVHRVNIHIAGPLAEVTVERTVEPGPALLERILDLDLPEGAALVDVSVTQAGKTTHLSAAPEAAARATYARTISARGLAPARVPVDPGMDLRLHFAAAAPDSRLLVRYRYTAPLLCSSGRFVLHVPPSLEDNPVAAQVQVSFDGLDMEEATVIGAPIRIRGRRVRASGTAPPRAAWQIGFRLRDRAGQFPAQVLAARSLSPRRAGQRPEHVLSLSVCRPERTPERAIPQSVILLIDRSRSVGQGGMSGQRALARALLEALPASVRFNAVFFARRTEPLFALPRAATREALDLLSAAADPNRLENGTHLAGALKAATAMLQGDPLAPGQRRWLVLISDGAVAEGETGATLAAALGVGSRGSADFVGLLARPAADEPVPQEALAKVQLAAQVLGGVVLTVSSDDPQEAVRRVLAGMGQGGDLLGLTAGDKPLTGGLAPGAGITKTLAWPSRSRLLLQGTRGTTAVRAPVSAAPLAPEWLLPMAETARPRAWSASAGEAAFLAEAIDPRASGTADQIVRGQMDPSVLRNALSLAYLPRVRACYMTRRVKTAADFALRGRMRLELQLERGELLDAVVRRSDLGHAETEACVREAAHAIEYPRPMHRDAPTVATLNLVFRPRTPEESPSDASALDREIELILGPVTFDPGALVDVDAESP